MGTIQTRREKVVFVLEWIGELREKEKEIPRIEVEAELMLKKFCSLKTAREIVQCLIDTGKVKEKGEILY